MLAAVFWVWVAVFGFSSCISDWAAVLHIFRWFTLQLQGKNGLYEDGNTIFSVKGVNLVQPKVFRLTLKSKYYRELCKINITEKTVK